MQVQIKNLAADEVGSLELADAVFGVEIRPDILHRVVLWQLAKRRAGTHKAKTRAEIARTGAKLYKQKGTGRSRQGSIRAPHHVGGGQAHPPRPRDWAYRPPRKVRIGALVSALSLLVKEGRLTVVDKLAFAEKKTKTAQTVLRALGASKKALVVDAKENENLKVSVRNLEDALFLPPEGVNVYDLLRHDHLVVSSDAVKALEDRCRK